MRGTKYYWPLELLRRRSGADRSSDMWMLGATLCELFSEVELWNEVQIIKKILHI